MSLAGIKSLLYKLGIAERLSRRRLRLIESLSGLDLATPGPRPLRILDVGCGAGKDFIRFFAGRGDLELVGLDLRDTGLRQDNLRLIVGDAERLAFPDRHFDLVVSVGVLEHIVPMEKLARAISEIDRVARAFVVIVPAVGTPIEPHIARWGWSTRDRNAKSPYPGRLVYLSDEAWVAFSGFAGASTRRFWHILGFVRNLAVYKPWVSREERD